MDQVALTDGRIDVWHVFTDDWAAHTPARRASEGSLARRASEGSWDACRQLLSPDETERARRYTHREARRQFVIGRVLLRTALARYTGDDPRSLEFVYHEHGKPALRSPPGRRLEFSLSHTRGLVVCAVALGNQVGVDVESRQRQRTLSPLLLARRYFAPAESAVLARLPPEEQLGAFLAFWTLKEGFVKACGSGLARPLGDFAFSLFADRPPMISFAPALPDRPEDWQFAQPRLAPDYQVGLAVRRPAASPAIIVLRGEGTLP